MTNEKSTKQIIKDIRDAVLFIKNESENKKYNEQWNSSITLNTLAIVAILIFIFSTSNSSDSEFIETLKLPAYIISIMLSTIWIGINIERTLMFKELWKFKTTKIILSLSFTGLIVYCTAEASSIINDVFNIDPSFFPFTRSFLVAYLFFKKISILVYLLAIVGVVCIINIISYFKLKWDGNSDVRFPIGALIYIIFTCIFSYFALGWVYSNFNDGVLNKKVYSLAHQLDFNKKNPCSNLQDFEVSVIFLGPNQEKVLVDFNKEEMLTASSFLEGIYWYKYDKNELKILQCLH
ncbi:hypothetical protein [Salmonella enterica]|uniref:Uncharacterized protein n=2 Tax=Salmonella enterica TaxID=28901 RepID=A0A723CCY9_SALER|nr:hypothetical protein [Salmonella enterica]EDT6403860.1 hypothetical protein [Salmonella enterica subsp. enterica]HBN1189649.1 hypothetical protein [Salmonella enterica subsp. enterica serovar Schwarzengrund]EDW1263794.1 hypothetical protein [Salmonella enterica subsp. enterica]EGI5219423.1 hypothetical protein [Salmonella enterica subsp. enterica serovar Albany]EKG7414223.1 hypothetical protein [Salmonella enterica]